MDFPTYQSTPLQEQKRATKFESFDEKFTLNDLQPRLSFLKNVTNQFDEQNSTVYQQRRELQLLINELKARDQELNDMVHSHHKQLVTWECDRQQIQTLEKQLSKTKVELKKRHEHCKLLKERLKLCEDGVQSKNKVLETTQAQLSDLSLKASRSSNRIDELQMKNRNLRSSVEEYSTTIASLQTDNEKTKTALRLKEKELEDANARVNEVNKSLTNLHNTFQLQRESDANIQKESDKLKGENVLLKDEIQKLNKSIVDTKNTTVTSEDLSKLRQDKALLEKDLFHAGEREKRKDCLLELSKSRQERTEAELQHMRRLYDNLQREMILLKHRIAEQQDDRFSVVSDLDLSLPLSGIDRISSRLSISSQIAKKSHSYIQESPTTPLVHHDRTEDNGSMLTEELLADSKLVHPQQQDQWNLEALVDPNLHSCTLEESPTAQLQSLIQESRDMMDKLSDDSR